jgi:hypothetical protein
MSDKIPVAASWSKTNSNHSSKEDESIIVPNEDVFDLNDFMHKMDDSPQSNQVSDESEIITEPQPIPAKAINPEHLRHHKEEKYFYQPDHKARSKDTSNWFIITFLMTVVILGSLYFFFALEDKNTKISGLERQLSNRADSRVKGVVEVISPNSDSTNPNTSNAENQITQSADGLLDKNFSILTDVATLGFKVEKTSVSLSYLNNQIGTKTSLVKSSTIEGKTYQDIVDIYSAEKQAVFDKSTVIANLLKVETDYIIDQENLKSKNGLVFTSLKTKDGLAENKIYVGVSENYTYVIESSNPSNKILTQVKINDFISNIISTTSFN